MVASTVIFAEMSMPTADSTMSFVESSTFSFEGDGVSIINVFVFVSAEYLARKTYFRDCY